MLGQHQPMNVALTSGFHWAFAVCGVIALLAFPATATLLLRRKVPAARAVQAAETIAPVSEMIS